MGPLPVGGLTYASGHHCSARETRPVVTPDSCQGANKQGGYNLHRVLESTKTNDEAPPPPSRDALLSPAPSRWRMTSTGHTYLAYGLRISTPVQLPGLEQTSGEPDVTIEYACLDGETDNGSVSDDIELSYDDIGVFRIVDGRHVAIDPADGLTDAELYPYLIGPILGAILYQRGYLVLHASAVSIGDTAVLFLGASGAGKSTLAAACRARDHQLLSDDITAVTFVDGTPAVLPGLPYLKLTRDSSASLNFGREYAFAAPGEKAVYVVPGDAPKSPQPLGHLYLIEDGDLGSEQMSPGETIQALVGHTYVQSLLEGATLEEHFRQCTDVAEATETRQLSRPRQLDLLADAVQRVEQEVS